MLCISLYKRSAIAYKILCEYLLCPSPSTLNRQLQIIPLHTGCNKIIREYLKLLATEIDPQDLNCILMWDEMAITTSLQYYIKKDLIIGFEDWGSKRTRKFTDYVIVFYLRCLSSGNMMPIGYGFCN